MNGSGLQATPAGVRQGKWARRLLLVLLALLVIAAALLESVRRFYLPGRIKAAATTRLAEALGAPVQAQDAGIGWRTTALHGVRLFESGPEGAEAPWADIGVLEFDIGLYDVLRGETTPRRLTLKE